MGEEYVRSLRALVGPRPLILVGACVILQDREGAILLQRRVDDGTWGLPGGIMDPGETLEQTARRELREETGLEVGPLTQWTVFSGPKMHHTYPNGDEVYFVNVSFLGEAPEQEARADGVEVSSVRFFPLARLPQNLSLDREVISHFRHVFGGAAKWTNELRR